MPQASTPEHEQQAEQAPAPAVERPRGGRRGGRPETGRRMGFGMVMGRRLRRRTRWFLRCLVFLPLLSVLAVLLLMRSAAVGWAVERQLEAALGCEARSGGSFITYDGRIVLRDLSLRVPGVPGVEGEFLYVARAEIDADWSQALGLGVKPTGIRLYKPVFRVSASESASALNIQGLHPTDPDAMSGDEPVRIDVMAGQLELGEHAPGKYTLLRTIGISGELVPSEQEPGLYQVRFQERLPKEPGPDRGVGMMLTGRVDLRSSIAVMELLNVDLSAWDQASVPSPMRDVWKQLNVKGRIASTKVVYFPTTGMTAVITLGEVSMDAIVPAEYPTGGATEDVLSLRKVQGTITLSEAGLDADVAGLVENQEYQSRVVLKTRGLTTDAALECKIISRGFRIERESTLLPFCPPVVRDRLRNFCGPTGEVDADVSIRREAPGPDGPAPFQVSGWLTFAHGTAAFDRVPYPFTEMEGRVEFDEEGIDILRIRGLGADGAVLTARGRIAPPNHHAEVDIRVNVKNVPLDDTFMNSLPPSRAAAIDFLFSRARYAELLEAGLVSAPDQAHGATAPPVFVPGGRMDLDIQVHSPQGEDSPWRYTVDATIPEAGVLPRAFPLPIAARNVRLRLTESEATLISGEFRGLRGGSTGVSAHVVLESGGKPRIAPEVTIDAHAMPIDDLLLHAIEHASGGTQREAGSDDLASPAELLRTLRLTGDVDCRARITTTPEETIDFDIGVKFDDLEARPSRPGAEAMVKLSDIAGSIRLTNTRFEAPRLTAGIRALEGAALMVPQLAPDAELGWISASLSGELRGVDTSLELALDEPRSTASVVNLHAAVDLTGVELAAPLEEALAAFAEPLADRIAELRSIRQPTGRVSATVEVAMPGNGQPSEIIARLIAAENFGFNAAGERLEGSLRSGAISLDSRRSHAVTFEAVQIDVGVGDLSRAPVRLDGELLLEPREANDPGDDRRLTISAQDMPVESPAVALVLRHVVATEDNVVISDANPSGRFDAAVSIPSSALVDESDNALSGVSAVIVPRSLQFDFEGTRVIVNSFEGHLTVGDGGIGVEGLIAKAEDWTAGLDGGWGRDVDGRGIFSAQLDLRAESLTPGIRALFPSGLREQLDSIELDIDGPLSCTDARIEYRSGGPSSVLGELGFSGASLDIGAPLTEAEGALTLHAVRQAASSAWSFGLDLSAHRVVAAGLEMTGLRSHLTVGERPGELRLDHLSADCYAGRVTASAKVVDPPEEPSPDADGSESAHPSAHRGATYEAEITFAGVCFAPVLAALDAARDRAEGREPEAMPTELTIDPRRGRLDGTLAISGVAGQTALRSGVGSVRIAGGDVVEMPLVLTLVQLSNFQLPSNDRLDFLQALFHVNRDQVVFDQIDLLSSKLTIAGRGTMSWPDQELDLRFNSRAGQRVPLISDFLEMVRNEIATTRIRGTLAHPSVGPEPLTGTRELIGNIVGERSTQRRAVGLPNARTERDRHQGQRPQSPTGAPRQAHVDEN